MLTAYALLHNWVKLVFPFLFACNSTFKCTTERVDNFCGFAFAERWDSHNISYEMVLECRPSVFITQFSLSSSRLLARAFPFLNNNYTTHLYIHMHIHTYKHTHTQGAEVHIG